MEEKDCWEDFPLSLCLSCRVFASELQWKRRRQKGQRKRGDGKVTSAKERDRQAKGASEAGDGSS